MSNPEENIKPKEDVYYEHPPEVVHIDPEGEWRENIIREAMGEPVEIRGRNQKLRQDPRRSRRSSRKSEPI